MTKTTDLLAVSLLFTALKSYAIDVPTLHPNILAKDGALVLKNGNQEYSNRPVVMQWTLAQLVGNPTGTSQGIQFQFGNLNGTLHYGLVKMTDDLPPQAIAYTDTAPIVKGQVLVKIDSNAQTEEECKKNSCTGKNNQPQAVLGYRVIADNGLILYDGQIAFLDQTPVMVNPASIIEGPFVHFAKEGHFHNTVRISFDTFQKTQATVTAHSTADASVLHTVTDEVATIHHEVTLTKLQPDTAYFYTVETSNGPSIYRDRQSFHTAPRPGDRKSFVFAYGSDSRSSSRGGKGQWEGVNAEILNQAVALVKSKEVAFVQFSGDLIYGYQNSADHLQVQYRNWKRVIELAAHSIPFLTTMGNHDSLLHVFEDGKKYGISVDRFPFATDSAEVAFANQFVNPTNGPLSEDGASYDPNPSQQDFPSYQENVYYYIYDNMAMVVLNSDYWYSPSLADNPFTGGNLHGYLMDQQLDWLATTLVKLEADENVDMIFITQHAPAFPNSTHVEDAMWYHGQNGPRAVVKHTADGDNLITRGILEQRQKFLKLVMNSPKVVAMLAGDEHNFNVLKITPDVNINPDEWKADDLRKSSKFHPIYQIINGAMGAPARNDELARNTPWAAQVQGFSTQPAVVFFTIEGKKVSMEVINPVTRETIWRKQELQTQ